MKMALYIILGIIALIVILTWTGNKSVHSEITIEASTENVWEVLTDLNSYPEWNPVMQRIEGEFTEGGMMKYKFTQNDGVSSEIAANIIQIIPGKLLNQAGGMKFILTYNHTYQLDQIGNSTKVTIHEDYKGIGVNFWNPKKVEEAYETLNQALKERVEKLGNN